MLFGAGLNVILAPLFIYVLHMGISGAAIAQAITSLMYAVYILNKKSIFSFSLKDFRFELEIYKQIFIIGIPMLAFQLATSLAISLTNTAARTYGDEAIAAMGIVSRVVSMGIYAVICDAKRLD